MIEIMGVGFSRARFVLLVIAAGGCALDFGPLADELDAGPPDAGVDAGPDAAAPCDGDEDGYDRLGCDGGSDCDDADPTVYPGAPSICGSGVEDHDCDGMPEGDVDRDLSCRREAVHARGACVDDACIITACDLLFGDCDGDPANGCEAPLDQPDRCGACDVACGLARGCRAGTHGAVCEDNRIVEVHAPGDHTCVRHSGGELHCVGSNADLQVGIVGAASVVIDLSPVSLPPDTEATSLDGAVGNNLVTGSGTWGHACATDAAGNVYCWGSNDAGQLGQPESATSVAEPTLVPGLEAARVTVGSGFACALLTDRIVTCWGNNTYGTLGLDPAVVDRRHTPEAVVLPEPATSIAAGSHHACAILESGRVTCWGRNSSGECGLPNATNPAVATALVQASAGGDLTDIVELAVGAAQTCARDGVGAVHCWGNGNRGRLGDGTGAASSAAVRVVDTDGVTLLEGATDLASDQDMTCAAVERTSGDRRLLCWGRGDRIGDGTSATESTIPRTVVTADGELEGVTRVAVGRKHACALDDHRRVWCWGDASSARLGRHPPGSSDFAVLLAGARAGRYIVGERAVAIGVGPGSACVVGDAGHAGCWGNANGGRLGTGDSRPRGWPGPVVTDEAELTPLEAVVDVQVGPAQACARTIDGELFCWGNNSGGQLGGSAAAFSRVALPVALSGVTSVALSRSVCAVADGEVHCWGNGSLCEAGAPCSCDGSTTEAVATPTRVALPEGVGAAVEVSAGYGVTCVRTERGYALCFGNRANGRLGDGGPTSTCEASPQIVVGCTTGSDCDLRGIVDLAAGTRHACVVLADGSVWCWGQNGSGQHGTGANGGLVNYAIEAFDPPAGVHVLVAGRDVTCLLAADGLFCTGTNGHRQLARPSTTPLLNMFSLTPPSGSEPIGWNPARLGMVSDGRTPCVLEPDDTIHCWGAYDSAGWRILEAYGGQQELPVPIPDGEP